ncbi:MAG: hypothetical protein LBF83_06265 [Spirochaetaceae bacterium]|jgi:hypothetical protein|nr:hypothetical protein [Spirochaetaceae bacterium]
MSFEVIQKVGKYQSIYLADGYRNDGGKPRQHRTPIGKIDPVTGEKVYKKVYKQSYIDKWKADGKPIPVIANSPLY